MSASAPPKVLVTPRQTKQYLLRFATTQAMTDFRFAELDAVLECHGVAPSAAYDTVSARRDGDPFVVLSLRDAAEAKRVCADGVLFRDVIELWGEGDSHEACLKAALSWSQETIAQEPCADHDHPEVKRLSPLPPPTWRFDVEQYGASLTPDESNAVRTMYEDATRRVARGAVSLASPEIVVTLAAYGVHPRRDPKTHPVPNIRRVFLGRLVGTSINRALVKKCDLKRRVYLGPTALDAELALVMANACKCRKRTLALDPYCGTGSILVACAMFGSFCVGTDIDWKVLRGKTNQENDGATTRRGPDRSRGSRAQPLDAQPAFSFQTTTSGLAAAANGEEQPSVVPLLRKTIFSNFVQYDLPLPEIVRLDASRFFRAFRNCSELYDAVVADPPYGIRAGARRGVYRDEGDDVKSVPDECRSRHVPRTTPYPVVDVLADLLEIAARVLKVDGRLAYLLPAVLDFDKLRDAPRHPALDLVDVCEQPISSRYSRYLIIMRKSKKWFAKDATPDVRQRIVDAADAPYVALKAKVFEPRSKQQQPPKGGGGGPTPRTGTTSHDRKASRSGEPPHSSHEKNKDCTTSSSISSSTSSALHLPTTTTPTPDVGRGGPSPSPAGGEGKDSASDGDETVGGGPPQDDDESRLGYDNKSR